MGAKYKKVIKDKRLEAGKLMTQSQITACNVAIHTASGACGVAGAIPIPVADAVPISAAQVTMVIALGKVFDQKISEAAAKGAIGAAAATFVGRNLVKIIPIVGWGVSAAVAAGVTEAIGWTIAVDLADKSRQEYERKKNAAEAAAAFSEAQYYKKAAENATKEKQEEAEDFSEE